MDVYSIVVFDRGNGFNWVMDSYRQTLNFLSTKWCECDEFWGNQCVDIWFIPLYIEGFTSLGLVKFSLYYHNEFRIISYNQMWIVIGNWQIDKLVVIGFEIWTMILNVIYHYYVMGLNFVCTFNPTFMDLLLLTHTIILNSCDECFGSFIWQLALLKFSCRSG